MRPKTFASLMRDFLADEGEGGRGVAMVEFALAFPLQLFITFGLMQLIFLFVAELVSNFAAVRAARTLIVNIEDDPLMEARARETAAMVLAPLAGRSLGADGPAAVVPGWGELRGADIAYSKVYVEVERDVLEGREGGTGLIRVKLIWYQELMFPFVDRLLALLYNADERDSLFGDAEVTVFGLDEPSDMIMATDAEGSPVQVIQTPGGAKIVHYRIVQEHVMPYNPWIDYASALEFIMP